MSTFTLSPAEFGALAATLHTARDSLRRPLFPLSSAERWEHKVLVEPLRYQSEEEYARSLINPFVYRLYLANALAERYSYLEDGQDAITIPLIEMPAISPVSLSKLRKILDCLSYNLVTNGGQSFLGVKDDEKLRVITDLVKTELLERAAAA